MPPSETASGNPDTTVITADTVTTVTVSESGSTDNSLINQECTDNGNQECADNGNQECTDNGNQECVNGDDGTFSSLLPEKESKEYEPTGPAVYLRTTHWQTERDRRIHREKQGTEL